MGYGGAFATAFKIVIPSVFFAIIGGLIFHKLIGMYVVGDITPMQCVFTAGIYIGMIISIVTLKLLTALVLLILLIGLLVIPKLMDRRQLRTLYDEKTEQFRAALADDPQNLAARERLAEMLYKQGHLDDAITEMAEVARRSPDARQNAYRLEQWVKEREERKAPPIVCPSCGHSNPSGRTHCYNCEASLSVSVELAKWLRHGGAKEIAVTSAIAFGVITLVMAGLTMLPMAMRVVIICAVIMVLLIVFYVRMHFDST